MVTGLVRALVRRVRSEADAGSPVVTPRAELLRAAVWRAARYGTDGSLVDLRSCRSVPAAVLIGDLLLTLRPALEQAAEWEEVSGLVAARLERGTGAARQRRAHARRGILEDVVDAAAAETVP